MKKRQINLLVLAAAAAVSLAAWHSLPPMNSVRIDAMAAVDEDGWVYIFGGSDLDGWLTSAEKFVFGSGWTGLADLPSPLAQGNAAFYLGKIYIAGGFDGADLVRTLFIYDVPNNTWSTGRNVFEARYGYTLDAAGEFLYLAGGADENDVSRKTCWQYDPANDSWTNMAPMAQARRYHGSAVSEGRIYVFGGIDDASPTPAYLDSTEVYDPATNTWEALATMPVSFWGGAAGIVNDLIWACHGIQDGEVSAACHQYDPGADTWTSGQDAVESRYRVASDGFPFYVAGGLQIGGYEPEAVAAVECWYEPSADDDTQDDDTADDDTEDDDTIDDDAADDDVTDDDADDDEADDDSAPSGDDDDDDDDGCGCD